MLIMTIEPLRKCITITQSTVLQWRWPQLDLNASVTKHSCLRDKGDRRKRATLILMKKCNSLPPFPMLLKKMIAQTQRSPKS